MHVVNEKKKKHTRRKKKEKHNIERKTKHFIWWFIAILPHLSLRVIFSFLAFCFGKGIVVRRVWMEICHSNVSTIDMSNNLLLMLGYGKYVGCAWYSNRRKFNYFMLFIFMIILHCIKQFVLFYLLIRWIQYILLIKLYFCFVTRWIYARSKCDWQFL